MGGSRMGMDGYTRFFRKQSFMVNTGDVDADPGVSMKRKCAPLIQVAFDLAHGRWRA